MSARIYSSGQTEAPRKSFETPLFVVQEWPEHIALSCKAIRRRRASESAVLTRSGEWQPNIARLGRKET